MIRWHVRKIKAKLWGITLPWNEKMVKVRVNRRLDAMTAIKFLEGVRKDSDCIVPEPEAIFVEDYGFVLLEDYLITLEGGV